MDSYYELLPMLEHYGCMVDLLGRAGRLAEAASLVSQMPFCVTISVWNSLFSACQRPGIVDLGRLMFDHVVELDMGHSAAYVSLGNLFATGFRSWDL
jgi:pentatricopeptide repeat protein